MGYQRTKAESEKIRAEIGSMLINGYSHDQIIENCRNLFNLTPKNTERYKTLVYKRWKSINEKDKSYSLNEAIERRQYLYQKNLEEKDYRAALQTDRDLRELQQLYKTQVEHSGTITIDIEE